MTKGIRDLIQLLRPQQYVKNSFVLLGLLFNGDWSREIVLLAVMAFCSFCLTSSAVYVFNDVLDVNADREHPTKRNRPLARQAISLSTARMTSFGLALGGALLASQISATAVGIIVAYLCINVGYSFSWKHVVILDVFVIAMGFMLRIFMGTTGLGISPSHWLLLCGFMLTLFLGFAKRRAELLVLEQAGITDRQTMRKVLDDYTPKLIEQFLGITAACAIISYSLYTVNPDTVERFGTDALIYSVPLVVYGVFRYVFIVYQRGLGNDTSRDLLSDRHLLVTVACWVSLVVYLVSRF